MQRVRRVSISSELLMCDELYHECTMIASALPTFIRIVCLKLFLISLLRRLMILVLNFINGIRAHVQYRTFETLQMELYRVVDYDSKWSTKFHNDCILDFFISLSRRLMITFLNF